MMTSKLHDELKVEYELIKNSPGTEEKLMGAIEILIRSIERRRFEEESGRILREFIEMAN